MFNNKIRESFLARNFPSILFCPKHGFPSANIVPENYEFVLFSLDTWQPDFVPDLTINVSMLIDLKPWKK